MREAEEKLAAIRRDAVTRARAEGRLEGMKDVLRELVRHGHQGGATFVVRELIAAERELDREDKR